MTASDHLSPGQFPVPYHEDVPRAGEAWAAHMRDDHHMNPHALPRAFRGLIEAHQDDHDYYGLGLSYHPRRG